LVDFNLVLEESILRLHCLIIVPTELVFAYENDSIPNKSNTDHIIEVVLLAIVLTLFCCFVPAALLTTCCGLFGRKSHFLHPDIRIGVSLNEWIIICIYGYFVDEHEYIFASHSDFAIFIVGLVLFLVESQYLYLMPSFALPHGVRARSKWGYAFNGELDELKRLNKERKHKATRLKVEVDKLQKQVADWRRMPHKFYKNAIKDTEKQLERTREKLQETSDRLQRMKTTYWDENVGDIPGTTPAMFALANGHEDIVEWLEQEEQGAVEHASFVANVDSMEEKIKIARNRTISSQSVDFTV